MSEATHFDGPKAVCVCGAPIVFVRNMPSVEGGEVWRKEGTGEVCVQAHWHKPRMPVDKQQPTEAGVAHEPFACKDHSDAWIQCSCGWGKFGNDGTDWLEHVRESRTAPGPEMPKALAFEEFFERSKNDRAIIVGSEVRGVIAACRDAEAKVAALAQELATAYGEIKRNANLVDLVYMDADGENPNPRTWKAEAQSLQAQVAELQQRVDQKWNEAIEAAAQRWDGIGDYTAAEIRQLKHPESLKEEKN